LAPASSIRRFDREAEPGARHRPRRRLREQPIERSEIDEDVAREEQIEALRCLLQIRFDPGNGQIVVHLSCFCLRQHSRRQVDADQALDDRS